MSVVAVKVEETKITVASDSMIIRGDSKVFNFKKLQKFDNLVIGAVGYAEEIQLLFEYAQKYKPSTTTISSLMNYMKSFSQFKKDYTDDGRIENTYIIVFKGHVFEVEGFFVQEVDEYAAIGQGEPYANAALYLDHSAVEAVKAACNFSCSVGEPILVEEIKR